MESASLDACPRCLAKDNVRSPLTWHLREGGKDVERRALEFAQDYLAKSGGVDTGRAARPRPRQV
jgi:hypothetical protein